MPSQDSDAIEMQAIRPAILDCDYNRDAGNKGPAVSSLAALMNCIPGFNTAHLKGLLLKLQIPPVVEVPGLTKSEAVGAI